MATIPPFGMRSALSGVDTRLSDPVQKWWIEDVEDPVVWWNNRGKIVSVPNDQSFLHLPRSREEDSRTVSRLVTAGKRCSRMRDLEGGKKLHMEAAAAAGLDCNRYVAAALITMYGRCRRMPLAQQVFDNMVYRDVYVWNSLIEGYVQNGESFVAMDLFTRIDCEPSSFTFVSVLKACGSLANAKDADKEIFLSKGVSIHEQARERGFDTNDMFVANTLIDMYSKCSNMDRAKQVFDRMVFKDVVTWTSLIVGYVQNGDCSTAMDIFTAMDCKPDAFTYAAALKACGGLLNSETEPEKKQVCLEKVTAIHKQVKDSGFHSDLVVRSALVDMYSKCGSMDSAREVFDGMLSKDAVTWTSLILGYVQNGESSVAMDLLNRMDCKQPDSLTYVAALKVCAGLASENESEKHFCLQKGISIHKRLKARGFEFDIVVASTLVDMYCKCGRMDQARSVFDRMPYKNVVSWNSLILGYMQNGECLVAMDLFISMDCEPSSFTYVATLNACAALAGKSKSEKRFCLDKGIAIHKEVNDRGFDSNIFVASSLVDMYCKCGSMKLAREVFDSMARKNVVTWNSLILGYVQNGESSVAMELFTRMDCEPTSFTYVAVIKGCGELARETQEKQFYLSKGAAVHKKATDRGLDSEVFVGSALIDMYCKCGNVPLAKEVFDRMVTKNVVVWNSLILGYVENGDSMAAMELYSSMDCEPDSATFTAALKACASLALLPAGQAVHAAVCKLGLEQDSEVATMLIDFYGKCGSITRSEELFNNIQSPDLVSWNTLMEGYSFSEEPLRVFSLLQKMQEAGLQMDASTFVYVLITCSHTGQVERGKICFESMSEYGVKPAAKHYTCMIDMLGRSNRLQEALLFLKKMPFEANVVAWRSLLAACRKWGNQEVGKVAFDALLAAETRDSASYDLYSGVCASGK